jgi:hypothetical protein
MADDEAKAPFQTHDSHVKFLRWLPLSPLFQTWIDLGKSINPMEASAIERTTREWARSIKDIDGKNQLSAMWLTEAWTSYHT